MTVPLGKLRDRVEILEPTSVTTDAAGGETQDYIATSEAQVWIKPLRGREFLEAKQVVSEVTHRIVGHYDELKHVTSAFRLRDIQDGREFDVEVPLPSEIRDSVELLTVLRQL